MKHKIFYSSDNNVAKFVFESHKGEATKPIAVEAVLYKYNSYQERTVICCSTQCGCPVGCVFCGTGKFFVRNLTADEIIEQVETALSTIDCDPWTIKKFQIMFMSMGEPFLNYNNLETAILQLSEKYPNAQLLVSTSAPLIGKTYDYFNRFVLLSQKIEKVGIQFSVHASNNFERTKIIPTSTSSLEGIGYLGKKWAKETGRRPFFNYCVHEKNNTYSDVDRLAENFNPDVWECTLSVICEKDNTVKNSIEQKIQLINDFSDRMKAAGFSIRVFNPAGQDDIGGGCGQLWYFQDWLKKQQEKEVETECTNTNSYGLHEYREGCGQDCSDCEYNQPIEK